MSPPVVHRGVYENYSCHAVSVNQKEAYATCPTLPYHSNSVPHGVPSRTESERLSVQKALFLISNTNLNTER
jgi:hypothetical protein